MKIVILSTDTTHHRYFIHKMIEQFDVAAVFFETKFVEPKFPIGPDIAEEEYNFEKENFFKDIPFDLPKDIPVRYVKTVNDEGAHHEIRSFDADIGLVWGCGKIKPHVFDTTKHGLVNVHLGLSDIYRGLASALWAIHEGHPEHLGATVHQVAEQLDTGHIYRQEALKIHDQIKTHQIRYYLSVMATEMLIDLMKEFQETGSMKGRPQEKGAYYSFMPKDKGDAALKTFDAGKTGYPYTEYFTNLYYFDRRIENELCILLYHGVTTEKNQGIRNFSYKHLPHDQFDHQMKYISENCTLLSMQDVAELCEQKKPFPKRAVAVTFDDSFENVYTVGYPIMKKYGVPFTFYLTTGHVGKSGIYWNDQIEDCLERCPYDEITLPSFPGQVFSLRSNQEKIDSLMTIKMYCKRNSQQVKDKIMAELFEATGINPDPSQSENYRNISWQQLAELKKDSNVIIGGHTHMHNIMSAVAKDTLIEEIDASLDEVEKHLGFRMTHYAYPEGQRHHYNQTVIDELKKRGIVCCPSAVVGLNLPGADIFHLRRTMVGFEGQPFPYDDHNLHSNYAGVL